MDMMKQFPYYNKIIDKKELKSLIGKAFRQYGIASATRMADNLKDLGFQYATKAGFSLSLEDLRIPPYKKKLLSETYLDIKLTEQKYLRGEITTVERFQKVIDTWNNASETLKNEVVNYFKETDPLNPVYIMAFSGARGNISQVRQLVGMRGLMSDPSGQIIDIPIASNFREGLNVTEYFISSYGARKGLVDTALRTADSGYLTRRLVDVAQDVIVREVNCNTKRGIPLVKLTVAKILGRVLVEKIYHPTTGALIANINEDISFDLAEEIIKSKISKILVRSALTCESNTSICQYCYGWSLANDRLVDLGEAVGIIAAQSIGEPGTQLTMRTFHTGGVFTGEIAKRIVAKENGIIHFNKQLNLNPTRTRHGDKAWTIAESLSIYIKSALGEVLQELHLPESSTIFGCHQDEIKLGAVIAELPIGSRLGKEKVSKQISTDIAGQVYFTNLIIEETQNKQQTKRIAQEGGLIWILSGKVYDIPQNADIVVSEQDHLNKHQTLAQIKIMNEYSGEVFIPEPNKPFAPIHEVHIITSSILFEKPSLYLDRFGGNKTYILETSHQDKFILRPILGQKLQNYQIIADLITDTYKTYTGGMIKYLDLPVKRCVISNQDNFEVIGGGYILWVAEETHEINKDVSLLLVKNGDIVEAGTEIVKNIFCKNTGIIEILQKDDIIREIVIKPGKLILVEEENLIKKKRKGFLRPGEKLGTNFEADNILYWESLYIDNKCLMLIRPVTVYSVPDKIPSLENEFIEKSENGLGVKIIRNICFKDGEKVKSIEGVELIKTQLVVTIPNINQKLITKIQLTKKLVHTSEYLKLKLVIVETLNIENKTQRRTDNQETHLLVKNRQRVLSQTIIAQTQILTREEGQISVINENSQKNKRILNLTEEDTYMLNMINPSRYINKFQWVYAGDKITENIEIPHSGQIIEIQAKHITIRRARPYLLSPKAILYINNKDLLHKGELLAGLTYETFKTGDIVQGLPKIEEILEVRKKSEGTNNPHILLENKFAKYLEGKLNLQDSVRLSLQEIQLFLVEIVQSVYRSQGVEIADKHIEIIIKQMSSKVKIKNGGDTGYLPGDLVEIQKIEKQNETMRSLNKELATYNPLLLGITKASLNTESFISAASFQETTKILTEAAISGKLDWLKGLKENVIIGRLIPAGTGFESYNTKTEVADISPVPSNVSVAHQNKDMLNTKSHLDDIILDDRSFKNYD
uniref:RNA polymerase beta'' subunit n=1 Tax=Rhodaphanes brevistipitata TaxID=446136 RepID=UPI001FCE06D5|nr:RNA polymerase beta'' subunit [Rhodaphanes brevistipitata]UNJ18525.1 RNA polymerase beta'' subunit [Rhodaphanes brevistipitata]